MSTYDKYTVEVNLIPGLPKFEFETPNKKAAGVVMHSTANYANGNDSADGERNYEVSNFNSAFVHTFTDDKKLLQVADYNYGAWHAFSYANHHFIGNELCQFNDDARFVASYDRWVWLAARQLFDLVLVPKDKVTLWSHLEISQTYQGNHEDPISYLASHGKTWANVVTDVTNYYNQMVAEKNTKPPASALVVKVVENSDYVGKTLTSKVDGLWYYNTPRWDVCDGTGNKGDSWIIDQELIVNGGRMVKCHDGKYRTADPAYVDVSPKPMEWPYSVQIDGVNLKEAQEIVIWIGTNYKNAKAEGIAK